jgi:hypothetical protein
MGMSRGLPLSVCMVILLGSKSCGGRNICSDG